MNTRVSMEKKQIWSHEDLKTDLEAGRKERKEEATEEAIKKKTNK